MITMKKYISLLIVFLMTINEISFSAGAMQLVQVKPVPLVKSPASVAAKNINVSDKKSPDDEFYPVTAPVRKIPQEQKVFEAGTSAEIQKYRRISLKEAIDYAMAHNLDIISARLNIKMAKNDIKTANRLRNPYIQYFFNSGKASTDNPNNVGLIFPVEIAKRGPRKRLAKSTYELVRGNVLLAELNLRLDVRQSYVDLVSAKSTLKILDDQRKLLQELVNIAQRKYEVGAAPLMEVIQSKMTLNQLLIQENSAKTDVLVYRNKFNMLLESRDYDTKEDYLPEQKEFISLLTPNPSIKLPDFSVVENYAMEKRLDIKNARQDIDVAQKNLVNVVRQRIPDIEIGGGPIFVPSQWSTSEKTTTGLYVGGNITNIPLFYMYNPEIRNAKLQIEQKQLFYDNVRHQALMNLHSAYDTFLTAQMNLNYYNDILLSESKQFLNMAKKSYQIGKTSITDYIYIEQSYKNIMIGYVDALSNYYDSWVDVLRAVNDEDFKLNG